MWAVQIRVGRGLRGCAPPTEVMEAVRATRRQLWGRHDSWRESGRWAWRWSRTTGGRSQDEPDAADVGAAGRCGWGGLAC